MGFFVAGTGSALPDHVIDNRAFEAFLDTSDEWITSRTGMKERRISMGEPAWSLGARAAKAALEAAGLAPDTLDMIICSTVTPDYAYPSNACMVQGAIGARGAFAFDVAAACTGSVFALDMARRYLGGPGGDIKTVLVVGCEILSQMTDYTDRSTCVLFGDGAGAAVLQGREGLYGACLGSDPDGARFLYHKQPRHPLPFFGEPAPFDGEPFEAEKPGVTVMNGQEVYKFATRIMPQMVRQACAKAGIAVEELDLLIPHQANLRIINTAVKALGFPDSKTFVNIERIGNTSSATVLIGLDECARSGRLRRGHKVCLVGFGAGLTYGAVAFEY